MQRPHAIGIGKLALDLIGRRRQKSDAGQWKKIGGVGAAGRQSDIEPLHHHRIGDRTDDLRGSLAGLDRRRHRVARFRIAQRLHTAAGELEAKCLSLQHSLTVEVNTLRGLVGCALHRGGVQAHIGLGGGIFVSDLPVYDREVADDGEFTPLVR